MHIHHSWGGGGGGGMYKVQVVFRKIIQLSNPFDLIFQKHSFKISSIIIIIAIVINNNNNNNNNFPISYPDCL